MSLFVLIHRPGRRWLPDVPFPEQPGIMDHIAFMRRLDEEHRLILGGPFDDEWTGSSDSTPVGMAIIEASGMEEADLLAGSDESIKASLLNVCGLGGRGWGAPCRRNRPATSWWR